MMFKAFIGILIVFLAFNFFRPKQEVHTSNTTTKEKKFFNFGSDNKSVSKIMEDAKKAEDNKPKSKLEIAKDKFNSFKDNVKTTVTAIKTTKAIEEKVSK